MLLRLPADDGKLYSGLARILLLTSCYLCTIHLLGVNAICARGLAGVQTDAARQNQQELIDMTQAGALFVESILASVYRQAAKSTLL